MQAVIYVVAKAPRPGHVKTRLCPPLQPEDAAQLAAAFLRDTISLVHDAGLVARLLCRNEEERVALLPYAGHGVSVHVQHGHGLGAALEGAFGAGLSDGFDAVGVLGADTPDLPAGILRDSFVSLTGSADVTLGPSTDGGYYFLGATRVYPRLFRDMVWSTSEVAAETLHRCAQLGLHVRSLPLWSDVDDIAALNQLRTRLLGDGAERTRARHTLQAISQIKTFPEGVLTGDAS